MKISFLPVATLALLGMSTLFTVTAQAQDAAPTRVLLDMSPGVEKQVKPTSAQVSVKRNQDGVAQGLEVTIEPGNEGYPGIHINPPGEAWDLSQFGHVEARLLNTGEKAFRVHMRVDNKGDWRDNPFNTEATTIKPGESTAIKTIFGHAHGYKPGFKLNPADVVNILLFTEKTKETRSFRIQSLVAGGPAGEKPAVNPATIRVKPADGFLLGGATKLSDAGAQLSTKGARAVFEADGKALRVTFPGDKGEKLATFRPAKGRWDLREYLQVRVAVRNDGQAPITPRLRVESNGGPSDWIKTPQPLAPGAEVEVVVPFISAATLNLNKKNETGNRVTNDAVSGVVIGAENADAERVLLVRSIRAELPPPVMPDWLGKRPPVPGNWVQTLNENFDGEKLDESLWEVYTENYWDKRSHFSKDNVIMGDGKVRLRYEKKRGFHNDDDSRHQTDYASGYLDTFGRWVQRYGYFEARMKLPEAPGLWPAFWTMPDRGEDTGPRWKRAMTEQGGMEFDILEHLTRWGPLRYNIAMHYDGYGKNHKHIGTDKVYAQPDKDGYITSGLLWTPGSAIFYANGVEVGRWETERIANVPSYLIFYMVSGGWDNNSIDDKQFPADFVIDYVRAWQLKEHASAADGRRTPKMPARELQKFETQAEKSHTPAAAPSTAPASGANSGVLLDAATMSASAFKTDGATGTVVEEGGARVLKTTFPAGNGYPSIDFPAPKGDWNLAEFAGVQAEIANIGEASARVGLRVDNPGDWKKSPWNTEMANVKPGETQTVKVTFGKSYGSKGYDLDAAKVSNVKLLVEKPKQETTLVVKSLKAFGTAAAKATNPAPVTESTPAASAEIFNPTKYDVKTLLDEGAKGSIIEVEGNRVLQVEFPAGKGYPALSIPAPGGAWNLTAFSGVQASITNKGENPAKVALRVDNKGDWKKSPWNVEAVTVPPGQTKTVKVNFGKSHGGNPSYALDASKVIAVKFFAENPKAAATVHIGNITAFETGASAPPVVPATSAASSMAPAAAEFLDLNKYDVSKIKGPNTTVTQVEEAGAKVLKAEVANNEQYPGFDIPAPAGGWNLSAFGGVQVDITNSGQEKVKVALRVDNPGDWKKSPWNTESVSVAPGETKTVKVNFGKSYGGNPGYALDASKVSNLKIYLDKPKQPATILLKNFKAFSASKSTPVAATVSPVAGSVNMNAPAISGELLDLKGNVDLSRFQLNQTTASVTTDNDAPALKVEFEAGTNAYPNIHFPVPKGGWNLSAFGGVQVDITNPGKEAVVAFLRADNPGDWKKSPWNTESTKIPAGQTKTLQLTFGKAAGGPAFPLDATNVSAIQVFLQKPKQNTTLLFKDLKAFGSPEDRGTGNPFTSPEDRDKPVTPAAWLGQRPPVEGEWVQTLDENFDGPKLNDKIWSERTWWHGMLAGQTQRYSSDNLIFENGVLKFKTERRPGYQHDDPKLHIDAKNPDKPLPQLNYATGHIVSYDKWTQRYGYFEARVKLPTARGLWPAFWLMPDRGAAAGPEGWRRQDTKNGGMEIDILEHLTEWGPGRNNVAVHWDGYDKDHKAWGDTNIYFGPTPDGWHNFGLLWEPGKLTWYIDGIKKAEYSSERIGSVPAYLILNVQMGSWATKNVDEAALPDNFQVDYVRAWQLQDRLKQ